MDATGRRDLLLKLADLIERDREYLEELEALDNGTIEVLNGFAAPNQALTLALLLFIRQTSWTRRPVRNNR